MKIKPFPMKSLSAKVVRYYTDQSHITGPGQYTVT